MIRDRLNISFQSFKRIILSVLTVFIALKLIFSLIETLDRPQIQGKFDLYQTNIVLQTSEWVPTGELEGLSDLQKSIVGEDILKSATTQYQTARQQDVEAIAKLERAIADEKAAANNNGSNVSGQKAANTRVELLARTIAAARREIDNLDARIGILQAANGQTDRAIGIWQQIVDKSTQPKSQKIATTLIDLWRKSNNIDRDRTTQIAAEIDTNLDGWFRDRALERLYINSGDNDRLARLQQAEQERALGAIVKLAGITIPRALIGLAGCFLIIFYTVRLAISWLQQRGARSVSVLLLDKVNTGWNVPWDAEIVWQVFVLGFFFVGQFLLPTLFGAVVSPAQLTSRGQGTYVLTSYALMSILTVGVLYFSIKSYLPLAQDWFKFNWKSNWILWGIGGYLVATPIVVVVSLINDKIWHGQGGSNPLLQIVLEGNDPIALLLFFLTAAVAAPLFEEFLFRGFLLPSLTRYLPTWGAIGLSGLIFGVAHLSLSEILPLTSLGIILGFIYVRTRNLLAPMLLHSLWNGSTIVSLFFLGSGK